MTDATIFGRMRVAAPYTLADLVHPYGIDAFDYQVIEAGGAIAYDADEGSIHLTAAADGAAPTLRTWDDFRYQAGKGHVWLTTIINDDAGVADQVRQWGYFDDEDGLFFELDGTELGIVIRSNVTGSPVDLRVARSAWNVDRLDGTGPSGVTLGSDFSITDDLIYESRFQWLSVGPVQWYVNGIRVHESLPPITPGAPFMRTAQLPLTWRIRNDAAVAGGGFRYVCASVTSDGGTEPPDHGFGYTLEAPVSVGVTEIPLISLRAGVLFNTLRSRRIVYPSLAAWSSVTSRASITVRWNATLTGATWAIAPDAFSSAEIDIAATSFTGGTSLARFFIEGSSGINADLTLIFSRFGRRLRARSSDIVTITAVNEMAGSTDVHGSIGWREVR